MDSKNLYVLPVIENEEVLCYYCLVDPGEDTSCVWLLLRDGPGYAEMLSHGVCEQSDVDLMLHSLRTDLSLGDVVYEWTNATIH